MLILLSCQPPKPPQPSAVNLASKRYIFSTQQVRINLRKNHIRQQFLQEAGPFLALSNFSKVRKFNHLPDKVAIGRCSDDPIRQVSTKAPMDGYQLTFLKPANIQYVDYIPECECLLGKTFVVTVSWAVPYPLLISIPASRFLK